MKALYKNSYVLVISLISAALLFTACSNPASSDDEEEHSTPFGVALFLNGDEVAVLENGNVTYASGDHLDLGVGEETDIISIRWIAEDGDRFTPDENEGYSLQWNNTNESVLEVEQHEEDGAWNFHFVGLTEGASDVTFILFHNGHSDFTAPQPIEIRVHDTSETM